MKKFFSFLWRGALGGSLIPFAWAITLLAAYLGQYGLGEPLVLFLIPTGVGAMIGALLWLVERITKRRNELILRIVIGTTFATLVSAALIYWWQSKDPGMHVDYLKLLSSSVFIGVAIGMPAASLARERESIQELGLFSSFPSGGQRILAEGLVDSIGTAIPREPMSEKQ
jgi:hypothetical protein